MGYGLAISLMMHLGVLAWAVISIQRTPELALPEVQTIEASLVVMSDVTRLRRGDPDAKQLEAKAKDEPKPDKAKDEAPKPKPAPAPPPPSPAEPTTPTEKAEEKPKPVEEAKAETDPIADKLAALPPEPAPGPTSEELKRIEDEKRAEEQKKAEELKKAEEKKKEEEKKKAEEKKKKLEQEKKLAEERRKAAEAKKRKFDADRIAALIDKSPDKRGAPKSSPLPPLTPTERTGPTAGEREGNDTVLTARQQDMLKGMLKSQIAPCWRLPGAGGGAETPTVTLRFRLRADGSLDGMPQVLQGQPGSAFQVAAEAAMRAVQTCQPFRLPPEFYGNWKDVVWEFDPNQML